MGLTPIEIQAISETTAALVVQAMIKAEEARNRQRCKLLHDQETYANELYVQTLKEELKHLSQ